MQRSILFNSTHLPYLLPSRVTRETRKPCISQTSATPNIKKERIKLTALPLLIDLLRNLALIRLRNNLGLEIGATGTRASAVHGALKGIALPAEDVVAVLAVAGVVAGAEVEWLGAVRGPVGLVVELGGVPYDLVIIRLGK